MCNPLLQLRPGQWLTRSPRSFWSNWRPQELALRLKDCKRRINSPPMLPNQTQRSRWTRCFRCSLRRQKTCRRCALHTTCCFARPFRESDRTAYRTYTPSRSALSDWYGLLVPQNMAEWVPYSFGPLFSFHLPPAAQSLMAVGGHSVVQALASTKSLRTPNASRGRAH